jgi:hypothetical protein
MFPVATQLSCDAQLTFDAQLLCGKGAESSCGKEAEPHTPITPASDCDSGLIYYV